jgi:hypothetical protein
MRKTCTVYAAEASEMAFATAEGDIARAKQDPDAAQHAEDEAGDRLHEGEAKGFKKVD